MEVQWKESKNEGFWNLIFGKDVVLASIIEMSNEADIIINISPKMRMETSLGISDAKDIAVREVMKRHQETLDALAGLLLLGAECPHCGHALEGNEVNNDCNQCGQNMWKE